jgi:hypothetical protein
MMEDIRYQMVFSLATVNGFLDQKNDVDDFLGMASEEAGQTGL